jgi:DNA (cytosine-5)-methyltransferase 1
MGEKLYPPKEGAPTFIDLFCGCGGASLGLIQAGYEDLCGIDLSKMALKTYQHNLGNAVMADVRYLPLREDLEPTVVWYSPPCQGFSNANSMRKKNPRYRTLNRLMLYAALAIEYLQPKFIIMENVPSTAKSPEFLEMAKFLRFECTSPYSLKWKVLDCADFGVPQHRPRLFMVGAKEEVIGIMTYPMAPYNFTDFPLDDLPKNPDQAQLFEFAPEVVV